MLARLFLAPGRLAMKIFSRGPKRGFRGLRRRPQVGPGLFLLSLGLWLALAGGALRALDRAGFLRQALDVGVEAATGGAEPRPAAEGESAAASPAGPLAEREAAGPTVGGALGALPQTAVPAPATLETEMWLVILHTIPKSSRAEAERRQAAYKAKGLPVEILDTNAFPKLSPNFWIISLGPFDDRAAALAAADAAKTFNSGLMVRRGL